MQVYGSVSDVVDSEPESIANGNSSTESTPLKYSMRKGSYVSSEDLDDGDGEDTDEDGMLTPAYTGGQDLWQTPPVARQLFHIQTQADSQHQTCILHGGLLHALLMTQRCVMCESLGIAEGDHDPLLLELPHPDRLNSRQPNERRLTGPHHAHPDRLDSRHPNERRLTGRCRCRCQVTSWCHRNSFLFSATRRPHSWAYYSRHSTQRKWWVAMQLLLLCVMAALTAQIFLNFPRFPSPSPSPFHTELSTGFSDPAFIPNTPWRFLPKVDSASTRGSPFIQTYPRTDNPHFDDSTCHGNSQFVDRYPGYPNCSFNVKLTLDQWKSSSNNPELRARLSSHGVDGTHCSVLDYIYFQNKDWCPPSWLMPANRPRIFGVNLGGWLLLEPWLTPSLFGALDISDQVLPVDEWHYCAKLGKEEATQRIHKHWATWVTEDDIRTLAQAGINHVRIPIGYWILDDIQPGEPWVAGGAAYLRRALNWCSKYNIHVLVDLHTAPLIRYGEEPEKLLAAQSPLHVHVPGPNGTVGYLNVERTLATLELIMQRIVLDEPGVVAFEVLNEVSPGIDMDVLKEFYIRAYKIIRKYRPEIAVVMGGFWPWGLGYYEWMFRPRFNNVWLDAHIYHAFSRDAQRMSDRAHLEFACEKSWAQLAAAPYPTFVGEWSLATTDCMKWLNGFNQGARFEGKFEGDTVVGSCAGRNDLNNNVVFTPEYKRFLLAFAEVQMDAYEPQPSGAQGWFFWNFKTEDGSGPQWNYMLGVEQGFIPSVNEMQAMFGSSKRTYSCNRLPIDMPGRHLDGLST
eukprot:g21640.t1